MHKFCTIVTIIIVVLPMVYFSQSIRRDSFYVANWNVENLYDVINDPLKDDEEFLPESSKQWNDARYEDKLNNLTKVINYMNNGCGPDILAMEEVENINVVKRLLYKMRDRDYIVAHRDSPDARGIDVALMYDRNVFDIANVEKLHVELPNASPTRDILYVVLIYKKNNEKVHLYVNHWPSRRGGEEKSNINRIAAAKVLKNHLAKLNKSAPNSNIIILGDFNDEPNNESIESVLGAKDFNCSKPGRNNLLNLTYKKYKGGEGSYLYGGKFDMLDQIIISSSFIDGRKLEYECDSFTVVKPQFMIMKEGNRKGGALPTYGGTQYLGGFSDHFPVGAKFILKSKK